MRKVRKFAPEVGELFLLTGQTSCADVHYVYLATEANVNEDPCDKCHFEEDEDACRLMDCSKNGISVLFMRMATLDEVNSSDEKEMLY
jgi:hypothetical protein